MKNADQSAENIQRARGTSARRIGPDGDGQLRGRLGPTWPRRAVHIAEHGAGADGSDRGGAEKRGKPARGRRIPANTRRPSPERIITGGPAGRWAGATVAVAASGPSLTEEDLIYCRDKGARLIVVNATFKLAPWADVLYGCDFRFWQVYIDQIRRTFPGEWWSVSEHAREKYGTYWIRHGRDAGFSTEPDTINGGGNSGYQATHLAATFGASKIILLGMDMQRTGNKDHWHGRHEGGLPNGRGFANWVRNFEPLARDLKARGVQVVNCSRATALKCFPRATLSEAFGH